MNDLCSLLAFEDEQLSQKMQLYLCFESDHKVWFLLSFLEAFEIVLSHFHVIILLNLFQGQCAWYFCLYSYWLFLSGRLLPCFAMILLFLLQGQYTWYFCLCSYCLILFGSALPCYVMTLLSLLQGQYTWYFCLYSYWLFLLGSVLFRETLQILMNLGWVFCVYVQSVPHLEVLLQELLQPKIIMSLYVYLTLVSIKFGKWL